MTFFINAIMAVILITALILLLTKRYSRPQMSMGLALVVLITLVVMELFDHWAFIEWAVREGFALVRLWLTT